jgi:hypothetical protein
VQDGFVTQGGKCTMTMNDVNAFSYDDVPEYREESIDGWKCCCGIDLHGRHIIHFKTIGEISYSSSLAICMCDNDDL